MATGPAAQSERHIEQLAGIDPLIDPTNCVRGHKVLILSEITLRARAGHKLFGIAKRTHALDSDSCCSKFSRVKYSNIASLWVRSTVDLLCI